jgi:hypothetical protein
MVRDAAVTFSGSVQNLAAVLGIVAGSVQDRVRSIQLQPAGGNAAAMYVGMRSTITSSDHAFSLPAGAAGVPPAPYISPPSPSGALLLSEWYVLGTNAQKVYVMWDQMT